MIPGGRKALAAASPIVRVRLSVCRDILGYAYTPQGWHYFVAFLRQYADNPRISPEDSVLTHYYQRFAPNSLWEAMTGMPKEALPAEFGDLPDWPALPWLTRRLTPRDGNQHFGTFTRKTIQRHDRLCRSLYDKIREEGYLPDRYPDGYIRGHYLKNGTKYRFIVTAGQHRMAVLAALGYHAFAAKIQPGYPRVADADQADTWPQVINGTYTPGQARRVHSLYFQLDGTERARRLGLI